ncbi:hypothetical protein C8J57DRAFT_1247926 [Mycena rebaudengoi]|nr:hypothetical protein C8J57DRAFT_1247926 [Mycena rebaudengoi]
MPPGRKPLDEVTKAEHRTAAVNRYAEKHKSALRLAAKGRMQRNRSAIRTADAACRRKAAQEVEAITARKTRCKKFYMYAPGPAKPGSPPPTAQPTLPPVPPPLARRLKIGTRHEPASASEELDSDSNSNSECIADSFKTHGVVGNSRWGFGYHDLCHCDTTPPNVCGCYSPARCAYCGNLHSMVHSWAPVKPILCTPEYYPSLQHKHNIDAHSADPECCFYGVTVGRVCGVYSVLEDAHNTIKGFDGGTYFIVDNWNLVTRHWAEFCEANHSHSPPSSTDSSPPSSPSFSHLSIVPSTLTISRPSTPNTAFSNVIPMYTLRPSLPLCLLNEPLPPSSATCRSPKKVPPGQSVQSSPTKAVSPLALTPLKGLDPPLPPLLASKAQLPSAAAHRSPMKALASPSGHSSPTKLQFPPPLLERSAGAILPMPPTMRAHLDVEPSPASQLTPAALGTAPASPPLVYAISGHSVVFRDWESAFLIFQQTNHSEMLLTCSAIELQAFMVPIRITGGPPILFAVRGHPITFRNLKPAFHVFQATVQGEMLFTTSGTQLRAFMEPLVIDAGLASPHPGRMFTTSMFVPEITAIVTSKAL